VSPSSACERRPVGHVGSNRSRLVLFALQGCCLPFMEAKRAIGDITQRGLARAPGVARSRGPGLAGLL